MVVSARDRASPVPPGHPPRAAAEPGGGVDRAASVRKNDPGAPDRRSGLRQLLRSRRPHEPRPSRRTDDGAFGVARGGGDRRGPTKTGPLSDPSRAGGSNTVAGSVPDSGKRIAGAV